MYQYHTKHLYIVGSPQHHISLIAYKINHHQNTHNTNRLMQLKESLFLGLRLRVHSDQDYMCVEISKTLYKHETMEF